MGLKTIDWSKYFGKWATRTEIKDFLNSRYMYAVLKYLDQEYNKKVIYPQKSDVFKAFRLCSPNKLRVVILGQDPYFDGNATGLAFANKATCTSLSPSLSQIKTALEKDLDTLKIDFDVTLESWAKQGVLLLNTSLTVQKNVPNSHKDVWNKFTKFFIQYISDNFPSTIFLLWGQEAKKYKFLDKVVLGANNCFVLENEHPAYAERNNRIWECDHFSEVNELIEAANGKECRINW